MNIYVLSCGGGGVHSLKSCPTVCDTMDCSTQASLSFTISWNLLKLMSIESMMPFKHLILCRPHLLLLPIFPSIKVFSSESGLHTRWVKYWSFSFSNSPYNEYSGLISFRIDLLAVQGTLKVSSPAPWFENISSLALSLLYG